MAQHAMYTRKKMFWKLSTYNYILNTKHTQCTSNTDILKLDKPFYSFLIDIDKVSIVTRQCNRITYKAVKYGVSSDVVLFLDFLGILHWFAIMNIFYLPKTVKINFAKYEIVDSFGFDNIWCFKIYKLQIHVWSKHT